MQLNGLFYHLVDLWPTNAQLKHMGTTLDAIFSALADPTRRKMLQLLLDDDMAVTDLAEPFDMSLAAISKHLTVLTNAGLIEQERQGRVKWCKLCPEAMRPATLWIESFGQYGLEDAQALEAWLKALQEHGEQTADQGET